MTDSIPNSAGKSTFHDAKSLIQSSGLPEEAIQLIDQVVRQTRLWKGEKAEVAMELIAHFQDGLESKRPVQDLIAAFGQVKTSAKLIRRGKKRNRPLWWQVAHRFKQGVFLFILLYIGAGVLLTFRHPTVKVDYLAELNRSIQAIPVEDQAWPIYRKAWIEGKIEEVKWDEVKAKDAKGNDLHRQLRPGDADWPKAVAFLEKHKGLVDAARAGGLKPAMGLAIGRYTDYSDEDKKVLFNENECWQDLEWASDHFSEVMAPGIEILALKAAWGNDCSSQLMAPSIVSVLLPQLNNMCHMVNFLAMDMSQAASVGDNQRVVTDYRAMLGIARQSRETPFFVSQLVTTGIIAKADDTLAQINRTNSASMGSYHTSIAHEMATAEPLLSIDLTGERLIWLDTIQRFYSDDGHSDGTITLDGIRAIHESSLVGGVAPSGLLQETSYRAMASVFMPVFVGITASRKELLGQLDRLSLSMKEDMRRPYWEKLRTPGKSDQLITEWGQDIRMYLLSILTMSLSRAGERVDTVKAFHEATMVAMALEVYREKQGHYPATLAEMVPVYLPKLPVDYSTGGELRYKIKEGKPLLYGLGKDGKDDGGVWMDKNNKNYSEPPETGDWILYPPME